MATTKVIIGGDTSQLDSALSGADKKISDFGKKAESKFGNMSSAISGKLTSMLAPLIAGAAFQKVIDHVDKIKKASDNINFDFESYQELTYAAERGGASADMFGKSMSKLNALLTDAQNGNAQAAKKFKELGISIEGVGNAEEALSRVAEAAKASGNAAHVAYKLFGEEGVKLGAILKDGEEGLVRLKKEAHEMGSIIDTETARQIERLKDRMSDLKDMMVAWTAKMFEGLAHLYDYFTKGFDIYGKVEAAANEATKKVVNEANARATAWANSAIKNKEEMQKLLDSMKEELTITEKQIALDQKRNAIKTSESDYKKDVELLKENIKYNAQRVIALKDALKYMEAQTEESRNQEAYSKLKREYDERSAMLEEDKNNLVAIRSERELEITKIKAEQNKLDEEQKKAQEAIAKKEEERIAKEEAARKKEEDERKKVEDKKATDRAKAQKELEDTQKKNAELEDKAYEKTLNALQLEKKSRQELFLIQEQMANAVEGSIEWEKLRTQELEKQAEIAERQKNTLSAMYVEADRRQSNLTGDTRAERKAQERLNKARSRGDVSGEARAESDLIGIANRRESQRLSRLNNYTNAQAKNNRSEKETVLSLRNQGFTDDQIATAVKNAFGEKTVRTKGVAANSQVAPDGTKDNSVANGDSTEKSQTKSISQMEEYLKDIKSESEKTNKTLTKLEGAIS